MQRSGPTETRASRRSSLPEVIPSDIKLGKVLFGDDFDAHQLAQWVAQEREAFFTNDAGNSDVDPWYAYMRYVNHRLGFARIANSLGTRGSILVIGPGSGVEMTGFAARNPAWSMHFIEASPSFRARLRETWPESVVIEPSVLGDVALHNDSEDVVCAFSVLHHVANVTKLVTEAFRVMRKGGYFLVREPCSSMGDWRYPRAATPNERGISKELLVRIAMTAGFRIAYAPIPVLFEPMNRAIKQTIGYSLIPFGILYAIDRVVSRIAALNDHYWRDTWYKKFGPSSYFYVFQKPAAPGQLCKAPAFRS